MQGTDPKQDRGMLGCNTNVCKDSSDLATKEKTSDGLLLRILSHWHCVVWVLDFFLLINFGAFWMDFEF